MRPACTRGNSGCRRRYKLSSLAVPLVFFPLLAVCASVCMEHEQESQASEPTYAETTLSPPTSEESSLDTSLQNTPSPIAKLMARTGYSIVQQNGQRRYGPPPDWEGPPPPRGCEIFVGKIPRDCFEDELVPVFEKVGRIYEMRLMMDFSGQNRGYAFVVYGNPLEAKESVRVLNNYEIRKGRTLGICMSVDNCRLFVGGIPKKVCMHVLSVCGAGTCVVKAGQYSLCKC